MQKHGTWLETIKKLPAWIKGMIGFVSLVIGFVVLFRENFHISVTVSIAIAFFALFYLAVFFAFSKKDPAALRKKRVYRFPRARPWALVSLALLPLLLILLVTVKGTRSFAINAFIGTPTATVSPIRISSLEYKDNCQAECGRIASDDWEPKIRESAVLTYPTEDELDVYEVGRAIKWREADLVPEASTTPFCTETSSIEFSVASRVTDEWIRFETDLSAEVVKVGEVEGPVHAFFQLPAGGGVFYGYNLELGAGSGRETIPMPSDPLPFDFFELQPGEVEWIRIKPNCLEPGIYDVKIGITYFYHGAKNTIWSSNSIRVVAPRRYYQWNLRVDDVGFIYGLMEWDSNEKKWARTAKPTVSKWVLP